jgi:glutamine amidotransferase
MSGNVAIIDYQMGNLRSVQKALEKIGATAIVTDDPETIRKADRVILPGVGAFPDAMHELQNRNLVPVIGEAVRSGKPFLGICLGMQLLFTEGDEGGLTQGLDIVAGRVPRFDIDAALKVPHMGWNSVEAIQLDNPLLGESETAPYFYFVHSFYCEPQDRSVIWLECDYGGRFCAAIHKDNIFATQFHPEKSQQVGLRLLEKFVAL